MYYILLCNTNGRNLHRPNSLACWQLIQMILVCFTFSRQDIHTDIFYPLLKISCENLLKKCCVYTWRYVHHMCKSFWRAEEGIRHAFNPSTTRYFITWEVVTRWSEFSQSSVADETEVDTVSTNERPFQKKRKLKIAPGLSFQTIAKKQRKWMTTNHSLPLKHKSTYTHI